MAYKRSYNSMEVNFTCITAHLKVIKANKLLFLQKHILGLAQHSKN